MADDDVAYAAELDHMYELVDRYLAALKEADLPVETLQRLYNEVDVPFCVCGCSVEDHNLDHWDQPCLTCGCPSFRENFEE